MPFAVPGCTVDDRGAIGDARLLRRLRDAVDVGPERDDRLPRSIPRGPRRRDAGDAALNRKAFLLEDASEVALRFELLKAELAEAEHRIDHLLGEVVHPVDRSRDFLLVASKLRK